MISVLASQHKTWDYPTIPHDRPIAFCFHYKWQAIANQSITRFLCCAARCPSTAAIVPFPSWAQHPLFLRLGYRLICDRCLSEHLSRLFHYPKRQAGVGVRS